VLVEGAPLVERAGVTMEVGDRSTRIRSTSNPFISVEASEEEEV